MSVATALRRIVLLVLLTAAGGATLAWWRDRSGMAPPAEPPQWPPLPSVSPAAHAPEQTPANRVTLPDEDGACPPGFPVKAKDASGIYHVLGGRSYDRTLPDRCYADPAAAEADGYRRAKA